VKDIFWIGAGIGAVTWLFFNGPGLVTFADVVRSVGPGFGW
jgi:hypothetical protein